MQSITICDICTAFFIVLLNFPVHTSAWNHSILVMKASTHDVAQIFSLRRRLRLKKSFRISLSSVSGDHKWHPPLFLVSSSRRQLALPLQALMRKRCFRIGLSTIRVELEWRLPRFLVHCFLFEAYDISICPNND